MFILNRRLAEFKKNRDEEIRVYMEQAQYCKHCSKILPLSRKDKIFCDKSCASAYNAIKRGARSEGVRLAISKGLIRYSAIAKEKGINRKRTVQFCKSCNNMIKSKRRKRSKFCNECSEGFLDLGFYKRLGIKVRTWDGRPISLQILHKEAYLILNRLYTVEGISGKEICQRYKVSTNSLYNIFKKLGIVLSYGRGQDKIANLRGKKKEVLSVTTEVEDIITG